MRRRLHAMKLRDLLYLLGGTSQNSLSDEVGRNCVHY